MRSAGNGGGSGSRSKAFAPWSCEGVVGIALVAEDRLMLLTASANLYLLPMASALQQQQQQQQAASLIRPISLQVRYLNSGAFALALLLVLIPYKVGAWHEEGCVLEGELWHSYVYASLWVQGIV